MRKILAALMSLGMLAGSAEAREVGDTFAIQNVQTGKNIRPFQAKKTDGNRIVQYTHWSWKCMTWQLIESGQDTYQLRNLWTSKTLQPSSLAVANTTLWQQPLSRGLDEQAWTFIDASGGTYFIKLKTADLYLSVDRSETNDPIVLRTFEKNDAQRWRLVAQNPWF
ncbi:Ricin-type beta-trefoil lectin domain protein [compost metagenome]